MSITLDDIRLMSSALLGAPCKVSIAIEHGPTTVFLEATCAEMAMPIDEFTNMKIEPCITVLKDRIERGPSPE